MKLQFKTGLLASLGVVAFTPLFACACACGETYSITQRTIPLVRTVGYTEEVNTFVVNNDTTICYMTLPEFLSMYSIAEELKLQSYSNGVYIYENYGALCKIDTINDTISFTNEDQFLDIDSFLPYGQEVIKNFQVDDTQAKIISFGQKEEGYYKPFELRKYNFDIIDLNGQAAIIPFEPLTYIFATTAVQSGYCYDREKILWANGLNSVALSERKAPPSDIKLLNYNYDCLCFAFDYIYGLKNKRYIKNYDDFFRTATFKIDNKYMTYYDALHDTKGYAYASKALVSLIEAECDDGHSSYQIAPCDDFNDTITQAKVNYLGPRDKKLYELTDYYTQKFENAKSQYQWIQNPEITNEYNFLTFVHGDDVSKPKAVIKFDEFRSYLGFYYQRAVEKFGPNLDFSNINVLEFFQDSSNIIQFLWAEYKIREYNEAHADAPIKDVIIDISNNGGGAVRSLAELLAFVSDDGIAKMSWLKTSDNDFINDVVKVDTNFDGVFDERDGYGDKYNFYIVDSEFSFSCGNAFPYLASKHCDVTLIGNKTGGGSCWVCGAVTTPYGDIFNMSSTINFGLLNGNYFYDVDDGVVADIQLPQNYYYDYAYISNIIDSIQ